MRGLTWFKFRIVLKQGLLYPEKRQEPCKAVVTLHPLDAGPLSLFRKQRVILYSIEWAVECHNNTLESTRTVVNENLARFARLAQAQLRPENLQAMKVFPLFQGVRTDDSSSKT